MPYQPPSYDPPTYTTPELVGGAAGVPAPGGTGPYAPASYYPPSYLPAELVGGMAATVATGTPGPSPPGPVVVLTPEIYLWITSRRPPPPPVPVVAVRRRKALLLATPAGYALPLPAVRPSSATPAGRKILLFATASSYVAPAGSFVEAIGRALEEDGRLMGMLGGDGAMEKVWYELAPPRTDPPWVVFSVPADDRQYTTTAGDYVHRGIVQVSAFDFARSSAAGIADLATADLMAAWRAGSIAWPDGRLMVLRESSPLSIRDPEPAPGPRPGRLWQAIRQLRFEYSGIF